MTRNRDRKSVDNLIFTDQDPELILKGLAREGFREAALLGGAQINSLFARANLIDEICVTVIPVFFGRGLSLFDHDMDTRLSLVDCEAISDQSLVLRYRVKGKQALFR